MSRFDSKFSEQIESPTESDETEKINPEAQSMLDVLFKDDYSETENTENVEVNKYHIDAQKEMNDLFADDYSEDVGLDKFSDTQETQEKQEQVDFSKQYEPNRKFEEVIDGERYYYDDNGTLYRVGNELRPNGEYERNGYKYQTDDKGRIVSAEGSLHLKDRERLPIKDSMESIGKGDQKEGDHRGHLVGDQFDGSNGLENMVPQDAYINRNDFKNFENGLAKEVKDGKTVYYKAEPIYDGDSRRPSAIVVTYSIDGEESVRVFPNGKES